MRQGLQDFLIVLLDGRPRHRKDLAADGSQWLGQGQIQRLLRLLGLQEIRNCVSQIVRLLGDAGADYNPGDHDSGYQENVDDRQRRRPRALKR